MVISMIKMSALLREWGFVRVDKTIRYSHPKYKGTIERRFSIDDYRSEISGYEILKFVIRKAIKLAKTFHPSLFADIKLYGYCIYKMQVSFRDNPEIVILCQIYEGEKLVRITVELDTGSQLIQYKIRRDDIWRESESVKKVTKILYPGVVRAVEAHAKLADDMKARFDNLSAQIAELCEVIKYAPGGAMAGEAKAHFESLVERK
jgi:hypothetical protein